MIKEVVSNTKYTMFVWPDMWSLVKIQLVIKSKSYNLIQLNLSIKTNLKNTKVVLNTRYTGLYRKNKYEPGSSWNICTLPGRTPDGLPVLGLVPF